MRVCGRQLHVNGASGLDRCEATAAAPAPYSTARKKARAASLTVSRAVTDTAAVGAYNASGGKDQVAKYMDLAKDELVLARDALRDVLKQIGGL